MTPGLVGQWLRRRDNLRKVYRGRSRRSRSMMALYHVVQQEQNRGAGWFALYRKQAER